MSPFELTNTVFGFLKLAPRYLITIVAVTGILLFSDNELMALVGVADFAASYRSVIGIIFLVALVLIVVLAWCKLLARVKDWWRMRRHNLRMMERLNCLTEGEKQILRYYIGERTRANFLHIDDGVVQGLVSSGVIYQSSKIGSLVTGFAHNISDDAWDYLQSHQQLLVGTTNTYRTDKRPSW